MGNIDQKKIYTILMLAGCVPFLVGAFTPYFDVFVLPVIGDVQVAVAYYALGVSSFMAGTFWNLSLSPEAHSKADSHKPMCPKRLMITSNGFMLLPWLVLCIAGIGVSFYFSLAVVFVLMMLTDYRLSDRQLVASHYLMLRLTVTAIAVTCLVSLAFTSA